MCDFLVYFCHMKKILFLVSFIFTLWFFVNPVFAFATTYYWYHTGVDPNWSTLEGNWWLDSDHTIPAVDLPGNDDVVVSLGSTGPVVDSESWVQPVGVDASLTGIEFAANVPMSDMAFTVTGTVVLSAPELAYMGQIVGNVSVYNSSYLQFNSGVVGDVNLYDNSFLNGNTTVSGTVTLYDNASAYGDVIDLVVSSTAFGSLPQDGVWVVDTGLYGTVSGTIYGPGLVPVTQIVFTGDNVNRMSFTADAVFTDTSSNEGNIQGDITVSTTYYGSLPQDGVFIFDSASWREWRGSVSGTIFGSDGLPITEYRFLKHNANYFSSILSGDAYFGCGAENYGVFTGTVTVETDCTRYFYSASSSDWMNVENWYEDSGATVSADSVPSEGFETIIVTGSVAPEVDIDVWITPESVDASETGISFTSITTNGVDGTIIGDVSLYGELQVYATITGNAFFYDQSVNFGTITGNATFTCGTHNYGTVNGTLTIDSCEKYFYSTSSTDWGDPDNWFLDAEHTIAAESVPNSIYHEVFVVPTSVAPMVDLDTWNSVSVIYATSTGISFTSSASSALDGLNVYGDASFYGSSVHAGYVSGNAFFYDDSTIFGGVGGDVYLACGVTEGDYYSYGGTLTRGECAIYFYSTSSTDWTDVGNWYTDELYTQPAGVVPTESDVVYVVSGSVVPEINLTTWSRPLAIDAGDVGIHVTSNASRYFYPSVTGTVSFYGYVNVDSSVVISGDAYFYGQSVNLGTITGDATFACGTTNNGTVLGTTTIESCAIYFYSTSSTEWDDLSNWWLDVDHTVPASELPSELSEVYVVNGSVAPVVLVDVGVDEGWWESPLSVDASDVGISFVNSSDDISVSVEIDTITGNVIASGTVYLYDSTITGDVTLYGSAYVYGRWEDTANVLGTVYVHDNSGLYIADVDGDVFLYDDGDVSGIMTITGDVYVDCEAEIGDDVTVLGTITSEPECLSGEILEPTNITKTGVTLRAVIYNTGGSTIVYRGFVYVAVADMSDEDAVQYLFESGEWGAGEFTADITGLVCGTEYLAVSFAQNEDNTSFYGEESGIVFFETVSCDAPDPSPTRSGGGASLIRQKPSFFSDVTQSWIPTGSLRINDGARQTKTRRVRLDLPDSTATLIAISNSLDFSKSAFQPFSTVLQWVLTPKRGEKTVYVKLLSRDGVSTIISDTIEYIPRVLSRTNVPSPSIDTSTGQTSTSSFVFQSFLTVGSRGLEVLELQKKLQILGFFPETVSPNGVYGPTTLASVIAFQKANGIDPRGYVGPATRAALNK